MASLLHACGQTVALRILALLLALGVGALPLLPTPAQHACHGSRAMAAMAGGCCCLASAHHDHRAPGKGSCCQELALDQHQPSALPAPESGAPRALPQASLVAELEPSARHGWQPLGAGPAPYPDGPPAYLRWGGFLT